MNSRIFRLGLSHCFRVALICAGFVLPAQSMFGANPTGTKSLVAEGYEDSQTIVFSGYTWVIKDSNGRRVGPGPCYFSGSEENVSLDSRGQLVLRITQRGERWYCPELISKESFGFGTYRFYLGSPVSRIDPNAILGLFTWSDSREFAHREIDIECAKWGKADDTNNAQFVVQPYQPPGRLLRFRIPPDLETPILSFTWESNRIYFQCHSGQVLGTTSTNSVIREWAFSKTNIPQPGDENARINLWLFGGRAPKNTNTTEVTISRFEFVTLRGASQPTAKPK
jgi:hypothetical protein